MKKPTPSQTALLVEAVDRYRRDGPLRGAVTLLGLAAWAVPDPYARLAEARKATQRLRDLGYLEANGAVLSGLPLFTPTEKAIAYVDASRS